jgi:hypothetical protein
MKNTVYWLRCRLVRRQPDVSEEHTYSWLMSKTSKKPAEAERTVRGKPGAI